MSLTISGYVLEPPRVGQANSPFTYTPNIYILDQAAFDAAYPVDESAPRTEYHVFVLSDDLQPPTGPGGNHSFVDTSFAWTKNEVVQRFDYKGAEGRFRTLPGDAPFVAGQLTASANTTRLKVLPPISTSFSTYPVRLSVGVASGTSFTVTTVLTDAGFGTPTAGTVELALDTGHLNWNASDITTFAGQAVRFQRQTFYSFDESTGKIGIIDDVLLLNPLPAAGQFPLVRIGYGEYLTPVQVANEAGFSSNPTAGTVEWAVTTGRLKFNSGDKAANSTRAVYYDGSTFAFGISIKTFSLGTVNTPGVLTPLPSEDSDLFFRVPGIVQFAETHFVDTLTTPGKKGVVQVRRSDGQLQFSNSDKGRFGSDAVQAVVADLDIERGMTLRLFRSPVNLDGTSTSVKDASAFYASTSAIWAQPIIASPTVALPAVPVDTRTVTVSVIQGTGTFTGTLPRLDVATPPTGLGYIIDYDKRDLIYAQRKANIVIPAPIPYGGVQLPDPLLFDSNLLLELETAPSSGIYTPLTIGADALVDLPSGLVTTVSTAGSNVTSGSGATFSGTTFTDASQNFSSIVHVGDYLVALNGPSKGVYTVVSVGSSTLTTDVSGGTASNISYEVLRGVEILVDRYFKEIPPVDPNTRVERLQSLGTISNSPRLSVDPKKASAYRFRFGLVFSSTTVTVANDGAFTSPASLPQGMVEISLATGHVNFSQLDVTAGGEVFSSVTLVLGSDYTLQPPLGFIQFNQRFLEREEAFITYANSDATVVHERGSFLVRKEKVADHPSPTDTLFFNPLGREVAIPPTPRAFRGGRPQFSNQVIFDPIASSVRFIGAATVTDALPSGPTIGPNENVYVDYSIYQAIGGEQSITVLQSPMKSVTLVIESETNHFAMPGDRTTDFVANSLLLVDRTEVYLIGSSSYASGVTTVTLAGTQQFRSDLQNPTLAVSSGVVPSGYFVTELGAYDPVPRGASQFLLTGDHSKSYVTGTVVLFTDGTFTDYNVVSGAKYDGSANKTTVVLIGNGARQYSSVVLKRSVRPVLASPSASATTSLSPELGQPFLVFRRTDGQPGTILTAPSDYTIDNSGVVSVRSPLQPNEEIGIFYTGSGIIEAGRSLRASYTFTVVPNEENGLLNQTLLADYTTYAPDTVFWRVETFTNFRGELVAQYQADAQSSVPSGGPVLQNSSSPKLFEQGRESVFFQEGHLSNEDLVARPTLKYFNDAINYLEDVLQGIDGRVVGDHDGRFLFDGLIDNPPRTTFASITNQIDDRFQISPAPYTVTGPPFVVTSIGTFQEAYKAAPSSRFFPTRRALFGATTPTTGLHTGDPILDSGSTNLSSVSLIQRRFPWAVSTRLAKAGTNVIAVDAALGLVDLLRPAFANGMKVAIVSQSGAILVADSPGITVSGVSSTSLTFSAPLAVDIPVGSTVRLATADTTYLKMYRLGIDIGVDLEKGLLTYLEPSPPWTDPTVPTVLQPAPPNTAGGEVLDLVATLSNRLTAPDRFPALDGETTDDDGNRQFQILTPSAVSENGVDGYLTTELSVINASTGTLRAVTTAPFVSTGSLDGTRTVITNTGASWTIPPQIYDLVEIRSGLNANTGFQQIVSVGGTTLTVASPFPSVDSGFTFTATITANVATGTAVISPASTLTDNATDFIAAGVIPGYTVVLTSGPFAGTRRQVTAVTSAHVLQITSMPGTTTGTYRIAKSLGTFGVPGGSILFDELVPALQGEEAVLSTNVTPLAEIPATDAFFNASFTDIATGSNGQTSGSTFTAVGQTFVTDQVTTSSLIYIRSGAAAGVYAIQQVTGEATLTIASTFPAALTGVSFRVVSTVGMTAEPLNGVLTTALEAETFLATVAPFLALVSSPAPVVGDSSAWAVRTLTSDLDARAAVVQARITQVSAAVTALENELSAGDRLFDKRYTWIDSRINLESGILVKRSLAKANRLKAQANVINQLTKLLSVQQA
jgi:hypothetical protein